MTYLGEPENSPQSDKTSGDIKEIVKQVQQYPTPAETPEPTQEEAYNREEPARQQHTLQEIISDFNSANIVESPRER